jgi:hypothetical protein
MIINTDDLKRLKRFKSSLISYQKLSTSIYRSVNGYEILSRDDLDKIVKKETRTREKLMSFYGENESLIIFLHGGRPQMEIPAFPGHRWDVFMEALSGDYDTSNKGRCLEMAIQLSNIIVGKAKRLVSNPTVISKKIVFSDELLKRITSNKVKTLCAEFNNVYSDSPNAAALLFRTILLITLQVKLGDKAREDLGPVLNQVISQDVYNDKQIKKILTNFSSIPKTLLDSTHHSQWILIKNEEVLSWTSGLLRIIESTFK